MQNQTDADPVFALMDFFIFSIHCQIQFPVQINQPRFIDPKNTVIIPGKQGHSFRSKLGQRFRSKLGHYFICQMVA